MKETGKGNRWMGGVSEGLVFDVKLKINVCIKMFCPV